MARQDILVSEDAGQWLVEAREGGAEGRSRWLELAEDQVLACVNDLMATSGSDGWRELV
jgi:hypothetical protein